MIEVYLTDLDKETRDELAAKIVDTHTRIKKLDQEYYNNEPKLV